jgi:hypothetical protein
MIDAIPYVAAGDAGRRQRRFPRRQRRLLRCLGVTVQIRSRERPAEHDAQDLRHGSRLGFLMQCNVSNAPTPARPSPQHGKEFAHPPGGPKLK